MVGVFIRLASRLIAKHCRFPGIGKLDHVRLSGIIKIPPLLDFFQRSKAALAKAVAFINATHPHAWGWDFLFSHTFPFLQSLVQSRR
jgi:hypothetical protein